MRTKEMDIVAAALILLIGACTPSTQPMAKAALERGSSQEDSVIEDFKNLAYQQALDEASARLKASTQPADTVLSHAIQRAETVGNLRVEHEKAQQLIGVAKLRIDSEKGILNILFEDVTKADAAAKAKGK